MNKSAVIFIVVLAIIFILGTVQIVRDYRSITGGVVLSDDFDIEDVEKAKEPAVAALLSTNDNKLFSEELNHILDKDGNFVIVKPTTIPARRDDHYLYVEWNQKLMVLSFYMKGGGGDSSFEIWGPGNKKIASGGLTNEFRWYDFDVSSSDMSSSSYALFNYGGGSADIVVDQVLGLYYPESGLSKLTGLFFK